MAQQAARFAFGTVLVGSVLAGPAAALIAASPSPGRPLLALAPPWTDVEAAVVRAGGRLVGPSSAPLAALAWSDDPGFATRLHEAGAWLTLDAGRLAAICGTAR